ncbi:MAG: XTP/dITP diphosphohydrolase [Verrucomicrobiales bacterium]|jgi:XTP/dITP diphosphohydrolase
MMNRLIVATHNSHKTGEIREILGSRFDEVVDLTAYPEISPAIEDGDSFEANAKIKALHACAALPGVTVLADDSGLEVDALSGDPGVYSARYAGENATDADNRVKLLRELADSENRVGRFRCVLVLARDGEVLKVASGAVEGRILDSEQGEGGFGYDSLFLPEGHQLSFAEMPSEQKNQLSHRGGALQQLLDEL